MFSFTFWLYTLSAMAVITLVAVGMWWPLYLEKRFNPYYEPTTEKPLLIALATMLVLDILAFTVFLWTFN